MTSVVIINDGHTEWAADKAKLISAMDRLGWETASRLGSRARIEPESDDDASAYVELCAAVEAIDMPENADDLPHLTYTPAERAWLWS